MQNYPMILSFLVSSCFLFPAGSIGDVSDDRNRQIASSEQSCMSSTQIDGINIELITPPVLKLSRQSVSFLSDDDTSDTDGVSLVFRNHGKDRPIRLNRMGYQTAFEFGFQDSEKRRFSGISVHDTPFLNDVDILPSGGDKAIYRSVPNSLITDRLPKDPQRGIRELSSEEQVDGAINSWRQGQQFLWGPNFVPDTLFVTVYFDRLQMDKREPRLLEDEWRHSFELCKTIRIIGGE